LTGNYSANVLVGYELDGSSPLAPGANLLTETTGGIVPPQDYFAPSDYTTMAYIGDLGGVTDTLTVSAVSTPESSRSGLMLLGIALQ
jgi:hypothetical protein